MAMIRLYLEFNVLHDCAQILYGNKNAESESRLLPDIQILHILRDTVNVILRSWKPTNICERNHMRLGNFNFRLVTFMCALRP